jgi:hypothetical protein
MTSQIMILTKRFGLIATDKQQTMADGKTYGGIKKIFELSRLHSSGIMINGNADFQDVPMETLINEFKFKTNFRQIQTIEEIKDRFINFLSKNTETSTCGEHLRNVLKSFKKDLNWDISQWF